VCGESNGIDAVPGSKFLDQQRVIANQRMLFREEESENIFTEQFCTEQPKKAIKLISSLSDGNTSGTRVSEGRVRTVNGPFWKLLIAQCGGIKPMIEMLHRDEHAVEFYNCAFAVAQSGSKEFHWIMFAPPAALHRQRKLFSCESFKPLLKENNAHTANVACGRVTFCPGKIPYWPHS
jgi:hypothetical protein